MEPNETKELLDLYNEQDVNESEKEANGDYCDACCCGSCQGCCEGICGI